jgi:hypothetical protein
MGETSIAGPPVLSLWRQVWSNPREPGSERSQAPLPSLVQWFTSDGRRCSLTFGGGRGAGWGVETPWFPTSVVGTEMLGRAAFLVRLPCPVGSENSTSIGLRFTAAGSAII